MPGSKTTSTTRITTIEHTVIRQPLTFTVAQEPEPVPVEKDLLPARLPDDHSMPNTTQQALHKLRVQQRRLQDQLRQSGLTAHQLHLLGQMHHIRHMIYFVLNLPEDRPTA